MPDQIHYTCWTDSQIALSWIKGSPNKWKQWVANRVTEIQNLADPSAWSHCLGDQNPADLSTRGADAKKVVNSDLWIIGPVWLSKVDALRFDEDDFPVLSTISMPNEEREDTVLASFTYDELFPTGRWSSFTQAMRIVAWTLRFINNCKRSEIICGELSYDELTTAGSSCSNRFSGVSISGRSKPWLRARLSRRLPNMETPSIPRRRRSRKER